MAGSGTDSGRRIGIFGGTFDPPHRGHLLLAGMVRERCGLDSVLWVPNNRSPFKTGEDLTPAADRLAMVRAVVAGDAAFAVSDIETRQGGTSYTVETLRKLRAEHPDAAFRLIVGSDQLPGFARWRKPEEIVRLAPLIVFPRTGYAQGQATAPPGLEKYVEWVDAPRIDLSSTDIRARLRTGQPEQSEQPEQPEQSVRYMIPSPALAIIAERGLYR